MKGGIIATDAISAETFSLLSNAFRVYLEDIMGLQALQQANDEKLDAVMELVIQMRKEARSRKDFEASDKIRNMLASAGIMLKDEKGGEMSYTIQ
ncbi:Cysteine--tRNA ligase [compost metagenome]